MPKSSRHKSSKHSSRYAKDYTDLEKESSLKEKKGREVTISGEKRKLDLKLSKELVDLGNAEVNDECRGGLSSSLSSKKRKEKVDDGRWNGGDIMYELELSKSDIKEKENEVRGARDDKKSSRKEVSYVSGFDVEERKKSVSKSESKHHRSERKERGEKERRLEHERKGRSDKNDKSERLVDIVSVSENTGSDRNPKQSGSREERGGKHGVGITEHNTHNEFTNPEPDRDLGRSVERKRDGLGDGGMHHDAPRESDDRVVSSREEIYKSGKHKDDGHKHERKRDRLLEDINKDICPQDEKKRDNRSTRDYTSGKSDDKHLRKDKKDVDMSHKTSKPHGGEYERELDCDRERYRDHARDRSRVDQDRGREHDDREQDLYCDRGREQDLEHVHDQNRELNRDRERRRGRYLPEPRDRYGVRDPRRGREPDFFHDHDYGLHVDDKGSRFKDDRARRRSPDNHDDYHGDKLKRIETEVDKERSLSHKHNVDSVTSNSRHGDSPSSRYYAGADKYRDCVQDETKYGDSLRDSTMAEVVEEAPKYRSGEKRAKFDDNLIGEFSERFPNTKVSPTGVKEKSPSSSSFDRNRFPRQNIRRRSLDVDDAERMPSGSSGIRDVSVTDDRHARNLPSKNSQGDDCPSESPFYHKSGQGNVSSPGPSPGPSVFRARADSPSFVGSFGEDIRGSGNRYRRSVDQNIGRGPANAWNRVPNWPSPHPNVFMPFPPGPPGPQHVGFPPMMSHFPHFGARPTLDVNHQGIPYHLADGDRFPAHVRPIGWPNIHVWDSGNSMLRNDSSMYGHGNFAQRRDTNSGNWKQNGEVNMEVLSVSQKDGPTMKGYTDEASSAQGASKSNVESSRLDQMTSFKDASSDVSPMKEVPLALDKGSTDKTPESSGVDHIAQSLRAYLVKLDISIDLVDPELYNQCSLAIKGVCEYVEDDVDLDLMEEKADVESEFTNLTVDVKILPVAKESIFQRAMNLYKTHSSEMKSSIEPDGAKICPPSHSQPEVEETSVLNDKVASPADCGIKQDEQSLASPVKFAPTTGKWEEKSLHNSDFTLDVGDATQMPLLDAEKMEEEASLKLVTENVNICAENTCPDKGGKIVGRDSNSGEQLDDFAASCPLILCNNSGKVCEALISVSNELESVVLKRIHDAPESTH